MTRTSNAPEAAPETKRRSPRRRVWWWSAIISVVALAVGLAGWLELGRDEAPVTKRATRTPVVRVDAVIRRDVVVRDAYRGELVADAAVLSAQTAGELREVNVQLGDLVRKDQVLALIDPTLARRQLNEARAQVQVARAEQARARAELSTAQVERNRAEALLQERLITEQEAVAARARIDVLQAQVDAAKAQAEQAAARVSTLVEGVAQTRILAPFSGAVAQRYLDPGALVQPGTQVLRVVAEGRLRVRFRVPESALSQVEVGQLLAISTQATGAETFAGRVTRRSAEVSPVDRSVAVEGELDEQTPNLLPGMYANVVVNAGKISEALVVPNTAVVERFLGGQPQLGVFVVHEAKAVPDTSAPETTATAQARLVRFTPVRVLGRDAQGAAVEPIADVEQAKAAEGRPQVSSLEPGAPVVTFGADALSDGAPVRILAEEATSEAKAPNHAEPVVR